MHGRDVASWHNLAQRCIEIVIAFRGLPAQPAFAAHRPHRFLMKTLAIMQTLSILRRRALLALLGAALLSGCASTGGLHPVAAPITASSLRSQRTLSGVKLSPAAWPKPDWWKSIDDPQLDKLVAEALADNPDMTLVHARVRAALAAAGASDAKRKPTLDGGASVSGARVPPLLPPIANGHFGTIRYGYLSFKWNLDLWGGKRAAWQAAVGNARAAEVDAQSARLKLSADVVQAYFNLAGAYVFRHLARAELQRAENFQKLTRQLVTHGIANRLSLDQIEGETAADRAKLKDADNAVTTSGFMLAALLGKGPDRALSIERPRLPALAALTLPTGLSANLLGRRPDVIAARWRVEAAGRDIKAAKAKFLPNINISALAGLIAPSSMNLFALPNRFYNVAPAISVPIFEGGALRANLAGKDAARDIAVAKYNQTLVHAINQVATRVDDLRALNAQMSDAEAARDSAAHTLRLSRQRFRAGVGNFLESLTTREQLLGAEHKLATLKLARSNGWVELNEALGGGFKPTGDTPSLATGIHTTQSAHEVQP
jgi:NodT family efflux transporter outer membrane factor (OMF) lipoprotein